MSNEVQNLRAVERYIVTQPLLGSFGAASVSLVDICEHGVQIEHAQPLRITVRGRLWFKRGETGASIQAVVVWSHLSQTSDQEGKLLYRSGVKIENGTDEFAATLQVLALQGVLRHDYESLERKRRLLLDRESDKSGKPIVKFLRADNEVPPDQALLVRHARQQIRANPEEALKWFNRAKLAMTESGAHLGADMLQDRQDVLAVWEYLERSVDLATIARVFDKG